MTVSQRAKAIEQLEAKYKGYEGLGASLPDGISAEVLAEALSKLKAGDEVAFVKAVFSPLKKWSEDALIRLADGFDAEELSVEERVERKLAAEKKRVEDEKTERERKATEEADARRRKENEDAVADAGRQLDEHTKASSKWLVANIAKYPLIQRMDEDEDVDHVAMFRAGVIDYADKHGKLPSDEEGLSAMRAEIFDKIEARHRRQQDRLNPKPRSLTEEMSEFDRIELARARREEREAVAPPQRAPGPRTGAEEALSRLEAWEREQAEREKLSYGR